MYVYKQAAMLYVYPLSRPSGTKQQLCKLVSQITNLAAVAALDYTYIRSDTDFTVCVSEGWKESCAYTCTACTIAWYQEYIRDKSVQPRILVCITTFFENDVVKRHAWAW